MENKERVDRRVDLLKMILLLTMLFILFLVLITKLTQLNYYIKSLIMISGGLLISLLFNKLIKKEKYLYRFTSILGLTVALIGISIFDAIEKVPSILFIGLLLALVIGVYQDKVKDLIYISKARGINEEQDRKLMVCFIILFSFLIYSILITIKYIRTPQMNGLNIDMFTLIIGELIPTYILFYTLMIEVSEAKKIYMSSKAKEEDLNAEEKSEIIKTYNITIKEIK